jgi:hypothetical protein
VVEGVKKIPPTSDRVDGGLTPKNTFGTACILQLKLQSKFFKFTFLFLQVDNIYYTVDIIIECLIFFPTMVILYILLFVKLAQRPNLTIRQERKFGLEIKLALVGIFTSFCYAAMNIIIALDTFKILSKNGTTLTSFLWFLFSDLFTLANPYLLLLCSEQVRKNFLVFLSCGVIKNKKDWVSRTSAIGQSSR